MQSIASALGVSLEEISAKEQRESESILDIFLHIEKGAMGVLVDHATQEGFVLVSENDAKEYLLWLCERLPSEVVDECRQRLMEVYSQATDEPADYTLNIITARQLTSWLEGQVDELIEMAKAHLRDYKPLDPLESDSLQTFVSQIEANDDPLISYFQMAWQLVENAIEKRGGGVRWWKSLPVLLRRCEITPGTVNVIRKLRFILHQVLRSQSVLTKDMAPLIAQYALVGLFTLATVTPSQTEKKD
jgi:hypothetical protein